MIIRFLWYNEVEENPLTSPHEAPQNPPEQPTPPATPKTPRTLQEAIVAFSNPDVALKHAIALRWPKGISCPRCGSARYSFLSTRRMWKCLDCKKQFSVKVGTIFEDSPIGLDKWLSCIWLIASAKNGVSSYEVHRALGVTQKTAWFMLHRVRVAMEQGSIEKAEMRKLAGMIEADETYIGGLEKKKHKDKKLNAGRGTVGKSAVTGLLERGTGEGFSTVRVKKINKADRKTLHGAIKAQVEPGSLLFTDAWPAYRGLHPDYLHQFVDHAIRYVAGRVHTNGLENFWALTRRCIKGTYVHCDPVHLDKYLDEEVFRFNNRDTSDGGRFTLAGLAISGKRLTYEELTHGHLTLYGKQEGAEPKGAAE